MRPYSVGGYIPIVADQITTGGISVPVKRCQHVWVEIDQKPFNNIIGRLCKTCDEAEIFDV